MRLAVLGAGDYGTALGGVLAENGHEVRYYDVKLEKGEGGSLANVSTWAEIEVLAIPSEAVPSILKELPKNKPLIITTKGFLTERAFLDFKDFMVLSGPGFAKDIKLKRKTRLTATDERIEELFRTEYLSFDYTKDRRGVLMCGGLKNVYAILGGFLGVRPEKAGYEEFIDEVFGERREILVLNGAEGETVDLECGRGDLVLTCALPSRNYEFGLNLRRDWSDKDNGDSSIQTKMVKLNKTVEGVSAIKRLREGELKISEGAKKLKEAMRITELG
ncbi:MAG: hypothetical protein Q4A79_01205 [Candidatus Saccharibacteria bacterium]|nr:hypothetical protein [Candidatus Saccharibacteria bacterium]